MKLNLIPTGFLKLDGGAMFGIVPKTLWQRQQPADEKNLCTWAMRCLLIETGERKILVDCGFGDKQDAKWRSFFEPHGEDSLMKSLAANGCSPDDITDVFLTHLHFDHCGGAVKYDEKNNLVPTFPNATYWSNERQWDAAMNPNEKERASFLKENFVPLKEAGVVQFIPVKDEIVEWLPGISIQFVYGHTEAMMVLHIRAGGKHLVYCADLMPSSFHISLPWVMAYDIRPLVTLQEKEWLLENAAANGWILIFEHDPAEAFGRVEKDEKGRIKLTEKFSHLP
ncbi:MAG: MBL fold metallo-hydrolase [Lewinellaceae bacterium]|nr:MBL fold metallo-hydrolase [Saprospiraceae bacterium]MCB9340770.1 MBL fold metallo-hydrolase [Lewinellaceae bacterium]